jgi:hypothetical protein
MSTNDSRGHTLLTRRRVLASLGVLAVGALAGAELDMGLRGQPAPSPSGLAPAGSPVPGGAALDTAAPTAPPTASPSPSPTLGPRRAFRSRPDIAAPLIEITTLAGIPAPGLVFLTPANGQGHDGPMIVDGSGELVWMRPDTSGLATDLRVSRYQGEPVLTWWEGSNNGGIGSGVHVVADSAYRELLRISGQNGRTSDLHELRLTSRGTALFFADASVGPGPMAGSANPVPKVMDCAIQEIELATGAVLFEWHGVDHIDVDESVVKAPTATDAVYDFLHANSIEEDADGSLIMSARNTSTVYKIDRLTGRIRWRLGGKKSDFAMGPGTTFGLQHDARRQPDGTLTIFDDSEKGPSRGIVLRVDESAMTATLVREYRQPQGLFSTSQGNLQVLPSGRVFIGWGSVPRFSEFTPDGRLVLDAQFTATQSYRDYRFPWTGRPADPPAIAVDPGSPGPTVYASWNGATEVARWDVLAGVAGGLMRKVASAPRTGFETLIAAPRLTATDTHLAVRALDATGVALGLSTAIAAPA